MNAVEIEEAISDLALQPFDAAEFPFAFLAAFGNKDTTLNRLRTGNNNASDVPGGVRQRNNIHMAVCEAGTVGETLKALRASPATTKAKAKFILATDGQTLEAEELAGGGLLGPECVVLEKLFELYTKMTAAAGKRPSPQPSPRKRGEGANARHGEAT